MKFAILVLLLQVYYTGNIFCNEYWRTRNLSGSDYEINYNLNRLSTVRKVELNRKSNNRIVFNWNSNPPKSNSRDSNVEKGVKFIHNIVNYERNYSNIWWPWSSYEEWAQARTHNSTKFIVGPHPVRHFNESTQNNLKPISIFISSSLTDFNPTSSSDFTTSTSTLVPTSSTKFSEERRHRKKGKKRKNRKRKKHREQTTTVINLILDHLDVPNLLSTSAPSTVLGKYDNNEMDNEIRPLSSGYNSYNSYDSIPVVDMKSSLDYRIKKNQTLNKYSKGYSVRNFSGDINECMVNNGGCEGLCINTPGSYKCHCPDGFRVDGIKCIDVNECLLRNGHGPCQDSCTNQWGSYRCSCGNMAGTRLAADGHTCEDIDECKEESAGCSHECINTFGSAFCLCPIGFDLGMDWKTCQDIDECVIPQSQETSCGRRLCLNTIGSYKCLD